MILFTTHPPHATHPLTAERVNTCSLIYYDVPAGSRKQLHLGYISYIWSPPEYAWLTVWLGVLRNKSFNKHKYFKRVSSFNVCLRSPWASMVCLKKHHKNKSLCRNETPGYNFFGFWNLPQIEVALLFPWFYLSYLFQKQIVNF